MDPLIENYLRRVADVFMSAGVESQGNRILSILAYLAQLNIAKIDNLLGKPEFIG